MDNRLALKAKAKEVLAEIVLILIVVDNRLALTEGVTLKYRGRVLILIVVDNRLAPGETNAKVYEADVS